MCHDYTDDIILQHNNNYYYYTTVLLKLGLLKDDNWDINLQCKGTRYLHSGNLKPLAISESITYRTSCHLKQ